MDDVTGDGSSNVKFVSKRSMSKLRAERSRQKLQQQASTGDLEAAIIEEPKSEAAIMESPIDEPAAESTKSLARKPVIREAPMPTWRLTVILISLSLGLFLSLMDTVVLSAALVTISEEFEDWRLAFWAVMSYSLAYTGES
jgi:hypothetical protein